MEARSEIKDTPDADKREINCGEIIQRHGSTDNRNASATRLPGLSIAGA